MSTVREAAVKFIIINLARDKKRFELLQGELEARSFNYERIEGVDGRRIEELSGPEIVAVQPLKRFPQGLLAKDQGLTMSHRKAALHILKENLPYAFILEDDVNFSRDFKSLVMDVCANPPADIVKFEGTGQRAWVITHGSMGNRKLATPIVPIMGAACYFLSRRAAECLADLTSTVWGPADHVLAKAMSLVNSVHILPYPAFQRAELSIYHPGTAEMKAARLNVLLKARRETYRYALHSSHLMKAVTKGRLFGRFEWLDLQNVD